MKYTTIVSAILLIVWLMPLLAYADSEEVVDDIEEVIGDVVDTAKDKLPEVPAKLISAKTFARMHPAIVHFPIAWLMLLLFIDLGTFTLGRQWLRAGNLIGLLTVLSFLPALASGWLRNDDMTVFGGYKHMIEEHRNLAFATFAVVLVAFIFRKWRGNRLGGMSKWIYLGLIVAAAILVLATGHHGGNIVFGENYLPF